MVRPPCCSRFNWPLRVSLTDSMSWRIDLSSGSPGCGGPVAEGGSDQPNPVFGEVVVEFAGDVAFAHLTDHSKVGTCSELGFYLADMYAMLLVPAKRPKVKFTRLA